MKNLFLKFKSEYGDEIVLNNIKREKTWPNYSFRFGANFKIVKLNKGADGVKTVDINQLEVPIQCYFHLYPPPKGWNLKPLKTPPVLRNNHYIPIKEKLSASWKIMGYYFMWVWKCDEMSRLHRPAKIIKSLHGKISKSAKQWRWGWLHVVGCEEY